MWRIAPTAAVAIGASLLRGYWLGWLAYAAFNIAGVWLYDDSSRSHRRMTVMKTLAILMLPIGVIGALGSKGSDLRPTESASIGSDDEGVTSESIRGSGLFNRGTI